MKSEVKKSSLFNLIKSMSPAEKGYFKKFSAMHTLGDENHYLKLFDIINGMDVYDEGVVRKKIKNKKFADRLSFEKVNLYNHILKCLRNYYADNTVDSQLRNMVKNIEIMFHKNLLTECGKIISKAKKLAYKYQNYQQLADIIRWEMTLMRTKNFSGNSKEEVQKCYDEFSEVIGQFELVSKQSMLNSRIHFEKVEKGLNLIRSEKHRSDFDKMLLKIEISQPKLNSFAALIYYYGSLILYYDAIGDFKTCYQVVLKRINLFETNPHQMQENAGTYLNTLSYKITCEYWLKKYDECFLTVQKYKTANVSSFFLSRDRETLALQMELNLCITAGRFDKGVELARTVERRMQETPPLTENELYKWYLYNSNAMAYFGYGDYRKSGLWLNKILNHPVMVSEDFYCFSKIFSLILYYEMEKTDLLEYSLRSCYRFLSKRNRIHKFETIILQFIKQQFHETGEENQLLSALKKLRSELIKLEDDVIEKEVFRHFDYISWLDSKIQHRSFAEILKAKAKLKS